jgi:hypothetical protein
MILDVEFASGGFARRSSRRRRRGHVTTPLRQWQPDQSRVVRTFIKLSTRIGPSRRVSRDDRRSALGSVRPVRAAFLNGTVRVGGVVVTFADSAD